MSIALQYLKNIYFKFSNNPGQLLDLHGYIISFAYILPLILGDWWLRRDERSLRKAPFVIYLFLGFLIYINFGTYSTFIYFQF